MCSLREQSLRRASQVNGGVRRLLAPSPWRQGTKTDMWSLLKSLWSGSERNPESLRVVLPVGSSFEELAESAFDSLHRGQTLSDTAYELSTKFQLSKEDAISALHRVLVGIAAARPPHQENVPDQENDPIGWASYQVSLRQPEGVRRIME